MFVSRKWPVFLPAVLLLIPAAPVAATGIEAQRVLFDRAERDLKRGKRKSYLRSSAALRDYPLYPWLAYRDMARRISRVPDDRVIAFLKRHDGTPVADRLRHRWLKHRARRGRWALFARHYQPSPYITDKAMPCWYAKALLRTKRLDEAAAAARELWLVAFSQPPQCDEVFRWARRQGVVDDMLVWRRILLVVQKRKMRLADHLARGLGADARKWYPRLKKARRRPLRTLKEIRRQPVESPYMRDILSYSLLRAQRDERDNLARIAALWPAIRRRFADYPDWLHREERSFGLYAAWRLESQIAYDHLSRLPPPVHTDESRFWTIRSALRIGNWHYVLHALALLDGAQKDNPKWRYWRARALHGLGRREEAAAIWRALSRLRNYYGYLAADRIGAAYRFDSPPPAFSAGELAEIKRLPAVRRAYEFYRLRRPFDARRELNYLLDGLDAPSRMKLALLCRDWGWDAGAVQALAHDDFTGELMLRFPMPWRELVGAEARRAGVPEHWLYGIMRRESAFLPQVKSPVGALGLMQLMPRTARIVARKLRLRRPSHKRLLEPALNIRLGAAYLKHLHKLNGGRLAPALASYNAGYTRARRWLATAPVQAPDVWVDTIPFDETRLYVRAVLFYMTVYQHKIEGRATRLASLMPIS